MAGSKKFWVGMAVGALAGGAISLFDKATRQSVRKDFRKVSDNMTYIAKHPNEFIGEVKETVGKVRSTVEQVSEDVNFIAGKVEEIRDVKPQVAEIVQETKETFEHMKRTEEEKTKA